MLQPRRALRSRTLVILALAVSASTADAQFRLRTGGAEASTPAKESVYVRDSGVASEKLALAERMERLKEWDKSADVYQEIIDKYADRVVPTVTEADGNIRQYTSVALVVNEKLAKWPEEGMKVYRDRYEDTARDLLTKAADDRALLSQIVWRYFSTDAGKEAGLRLLSSGIERGDFASAAWIGRRLLTLHPAMAVERPGVLFQTALAQHLAGNTASAKISLDELQTRFAAATGTVRGTDVVLADALASAISEQPALSKRFRSDSWPMQYGTPDASAVPEQASAGGARLFSTTIMPAQRVNVNTGNLRQYQQQLNNDRKSGGLTGIMPAIDRGEMFFQDNARVYAINLSTGLPLAGWLETYPGDKRGTFGVDAGAVPTPRGKQLAITVTPQTVIAILGQGDFMASNLLGVGTQPPQLVSLDRSNGKRLWSATPAKIKFPDDLANLRDAQFYGSPLVVDNSIYVLLRASRGGQFEECHVVSLRLSDGAFQWAGYIASVANNMMMLETGEPMVGGLPAALACSDGRLYVQSNLGAMACLDAGDGKPLWINLYPRKDGGMLMNQGRINRQFMGGMPTVGKPFEQNPPIISGGRLFVLAPDSPFIMVYDASSGEELRRISRVLTNGANTETADMLLSVVDEQLVLANSSTLFVIPWKTFDEKKTLLDNAKANGTRYCRFGEPGERDAADGIRGRPVVSAGHIYVPTAEKLSRITLDQSFRIDNRYPAKGVWDDSEESPGNVIVTPDNVVVAGPEHVTVYTDLGVATAKLDEQLLDDPSAIEPRLRYAELLMVAGKPAEAIGWLDQAMSRMGGRTTLPHSPVRDRLFDITCTFAVKLQRNNSASPEVIRQLFERARDAADAPQQRVRYAMAHAEYLHKNNDANGEVALYQSILSAPELRPVAVNTESGAATAAAEAETHLTELLKQNKTFYAAYEGKAAQKLADVSGKPNPTPDDFLSVADEYPIVDSGIAALRRAADLYEQQNRPREAVLSLRRLLQRASTKEIKLQALESLARIYAAMPGQLELAVVRLKQAADIDPRRVLSKPILLDKTTSIAAEPLDSALASLKMHRNARAINSLPVFNLPNGATNIGKPPLLPAETVAGIKSIVRQQPPLTRPDRVVAFTTDSEIIQFEAGSIAPLMKAIKIDEPPIGCVYSEQTLVVVSPQGVTAISKPNSGPNWRMSLKKLPAVESTDATLATVAPTEPEAPDIVDPNEINIQVRRQQLILRGGQHVIINGPGMVNIAGNGLIQQQVEESPENDGGPERIVQFRVLSDRVVFATSDGRIASIDLHTGEPVWQARPGDAAVRHFAAIDDFVVVSTRDTLENNEVYVLDSISGRIVKRLSYSQQQGQLINLALSGDGVLVSMMINRLECIDLFDLAGQPVRQNPQADQPFILSAGPQQLVITDDRVLALFLSSSGQQSVRAYELRTLRPLRTGAAGVEASFPSGAVVNNDRAPGTLAIHTAGAAFYIVGPRSLAAYHLDKESPEKLRVAPRDRGPTRDMFVTQDYCVLLNQTTAVANQNASKLQRVQLSAYSRATVENGTESGLLEHTFDIRDPASVFAGQWQITNGAFYYVSADNKLKMLRANNQ